MTDQEKRPVAVEREAFEPVDEQRATRVTVPEWQIWPPGPKMQIAMIATVFGLFNLIVIVIVAVIVVRHL